MNCDEVRKLLEDYVYDEVSFLVRNQIEEHLLSCPKCREEVEFLKEIKNTLHTMPRLEPEESFRTELNKKLDQLAKKQPEKKKRKIFRDWRTYSALAACLVLAVAVQSQISKNTDSVNFPGMQPDLVHETNITNLQQTEKANAAEDAKQPTADDVVTEDVRKETEIEDANKKKIEQITTQPAEETPKPAVQPTDEPVQSASAVPKETDVVPTDYAGAAVSAVQEETEETAVPQADVEPASLRMQTETDMVAAETAEDAGIQTTADSPQAVSGSSGGGGGSSAAATKTAVLYGTVQVAESDVSKAKEIASRYGTQSANAVEMTQKQFKNYLNTLKANAIQYNHNVPEGDMVRVEIVAE